MGRREERFGDALSFPVKKVSSSRRYRSPPRVGDLEGSSSEPLLPGQERLLVEHNGGIHSYMGCHLTMLYRVTKRPRQLRSVIKRCELSSVTKRSRKLNNVMHYNIQKLV